MTGVQLIICGLVLFVVTLLMIGIRKSREHEPEAYVLSLPLGPVEEDLTEFHALTQGWREAVHALTAKLFAEDEATALSERIEATVTRHQTGIFFGDVRLEHIVAISVAKSGPVVFDRHGYNDTYWPAWKRKAPLPADLLSFPPKTTIRARLMDGSVVEIGTCTLANAEHGLDAYLRAWKAGSTEWSDKKRRERA